MPITDVLSPEDLQALRETHKQLVASGDPRATKLGAYIQQAQLDANDTMIAERQAKVNRPFRDVPFLGWLDENLVGPGFERMMQGGESMRSGHIAKGASDMLRGGVQAMGAPFALRSLAAKPLATIAGIGAGAGAQQVGEKATEALGFPEQAPLVGDIAGVGTGMHVGRIVSPIDAAIQTPANPLSSIGDMLKSVLPRAQRPSTPPFNMASPPPPAKVPPVAPAPFNLEGAPQPTPPAPPAAQPFNTAGLPLPKITVTGPAPAMPFNTQGLPQPTPPAPIPPVQAGPFNDRGLPLAPPAAPAPAQPPGMFNMTGTFKAPKAAAKPTAGKSPVSHQAPAPPPAAPQIEPVAKPHPSGLPPEIMERYEKLGKTTGDVMKEQTVAKDLAIANRLRSLEVGAEKWKALSKDDQVAHAKALGYRQSGTLGRQTHEELVADVAAILKHWGL